MLMCGDHVKDLIVLSLQEHKLCHHPNPGLWCWQFTKLDRRVTADAPQMQRPTGVDATVIPGQVARKNISTPENHLCAKTRIKPHANPHACAHACTCSWSGHIATKWSTGPGNRLRLTAGRISEVPSGTLCATLSAVSGFNLVSDCGGLLCEISRAVDSSGWLW